MQTRQRMSEVLTGLNFRHCVVVSIAYIGYRQPQLPLVIALSEKFIAHFQAPFATHVPRPARVRYVGALKCYLQDKVPQLRVLHV